DQHDPGAGVAHLDEAIHELRLALAIWAGSSDESALAPDIIVGEKAGDHGIVIEHPGGMEPFVIELLLRRNNADDRLLKCDHFGYSRRGKSHVGVDEEQMRKRRIIEH